MIKFTELNKKLKCDCEYIDNVMFGNYEGNSCTGLITFKSLRDVSISWNNHLTDRINYYLVLCDAIIASCSTSKNIVLKFKVQLS